MTVLDASVPERATANDTVAVEVTLRNRGGAERSRTVTATLGHERIEKRVTLAGGEQRTVRLPLPTGGPGTETVRVNGGPERPLTVVHPEAPRLHGLPAEAPPGSEPLVAVRTATGAPLANATVTIGGQGVETRSNGTVRLPVGPAGVREVRVETEHGTATATVEVAPDAERGPVASVGVSPTSPTALTAPEARTTVSNPWNESIDTEVRIVGPGTTASRQLHLAAGERAEERVALGRRPPSTYDVRVEVDGTAVAGTSYEVSGDERVVAALAGGGYTSGESGLGRAVEAVVGNVTLLLGTVGGLAAAMTIGGLSASMARAVHTRRRAIGIHRAVGAGPRNVLRPVIRDTLVIGGLGTGGALLVSLAIVHALGVLGLLTVYGIAVPALPTPGVVAVGLIAGVGLTVCSAVVAVGPLLYRRPADLLTGTDRAARGGSREG